MANVQSVARLPKNAFGDFRDVPSNQDFTYTKNHKFSRGGIKSAADHLHKQWRAYEHSHGGGAVCGGHLIIDGKKVVANYALDVVKFMAGDSVEDWREACKKVNQVYAEIQAEYDAQDQQWYEETQKS
jgi:hypothetical protein